MIALRQVAVILSLAAWMVVSTQSSGSGVPTQRGPASNVAGLAWWTANAMDKVRPSDTEDRESKSVELYAAANEFESFQVVLRSRAPISGVDVEVGDLVNSAGGRIPASAISIYLVKYLNIVTPSNSEQKAGEWPDVLIPRIDRYFHERRNVFPFQLQADRNQSVWIETYVSTTTPAGQYRGEARVRANGAIEASIPITLNVWGFALPSTSSLKTAFGFSGISAVKQHFGRYTDDDALRSLTRLYARDALMHRITLIQGTLIPPPFVLGASKTSGAESLSINWTDYDNEVGPFLDGTIFSAQDPLSGARATTFELRTHSGLDTDERKILYWREWMKHAGEKGWTDRLFNYVWDEPSPSEMVSVAGRAAVVRRADPRLPNMVTTKLNPALRPLIDIWNPLINCFEARRGFDDFCGSTVSFEAYDEERKLGKHVWWYQSCGSHGCDIVGGPYFTGWPNYVIDTTGVQNRIMEWLSWKYSIEGELYYNTVEAYGRVGNPLKDVHLHGGNGDGTLFYPGSPTSIGGATHIPLESIRLKLIRDGLEDYEYLTLLAKRGKSRLATNLVDSFISNTHSFDLRYDTLYSVRQRMGQELQQH